MYRRSKSLKVLKSFIGLFQMIFFLRCFDNKSFHHQHNLKLGAAHVVVVGPELLLNGELYRTTLVLCGQCGGLAVWQLLGQSDQVLPVSS